MGEIRPVKVEKYIWIARESSCMVMQPRYTVYLRVPPDVQGALKERYNIDLRREAKRVAVETSLTEERGEDGHKSVVIEHKIRMLPGVG
jgi:hypothetical protein